MARGLMPDPWRLHAGRRSAGAGARCLPAAGVLLALALGGRHAERIALALLPLGLGARGRDRRRGPASGRGAGLRPRRLGAAARHRAARRRAVGGDADHHGGGDLRHRRCSRGPSSQTPQGSPEARAPLAFWTLLLGLWARSTPCLLGDDLFNLFVALELLTFAAVPLVCLDGRAETLAAALRYLLFALLGSALYLLGAALLYGAYGTLDIVLLSAAGARRARRLDRGRADDRGAARQDRAVPAASVAAARPCRRAGRRPARCSRRWWSRAPFILIVRLWFDVMPGLLTSAAAQLLAALGAAAILFGSVLALRQARLKLLVAYSTVAQIGYLFLMFPLAGGAGRCGSAARRLDRRHPPGDLACLRQGRDVHGGGADRRRRWATTGSPGSAASAGRCR